MTYYLWPGGQPGGTNKPEQCYTRSLQGLKGFLVFFAPRSGDHCFSYRELPSRAKGNKPYLGCQYNGGR